MPSTRLADEVGRLPTYDALAYPDFLRYHLIPNLPFLLSPKATAHWGARKDWVLPSTSGSGPETSSRGHVPANLPEQELHDLLADARGPRPALCTHPPNPCVSPPGSLPAANSLPPPPSQPNFAALERYWDHLVPVADTVRREFSEFERSERPLSEVLELWRSGRGETLYVKDWHLVAEVQERGGDAREVYAPPDCFLDDWLSPPFEEPAQSSDSASTADFRFVYAGPAGTFTPLHRDVYGSYSWSANVVGRKLWWLFPPGREPRDKHGDLVFDVRGDMPWDGVKILQEEGEVIFVPSGWHHQVLNLDFCISINHNFFASPTLPRVYKALCANQDRCSESILDVLPDIRSRLKDTVLSDGRLAWEAEWAEEIDGLLARDAGWGWDGFWGCVRANLERPPSGPGLRPKADDIERFVRTVIEEYKAMGQWRLLPSAREIVDEVERLLDALRLEVGAGQE